MIPILLALLSCASFGISDYLQGIAARKASSIPVMVVAQTTGLAAIVIAALLLGGTTTQADLLWGVMLGILLLAGIALMIHAFSRGSITIASTTMSIIGIGLPALYGLAMGERIDQPAQAGLGLGLIAIFLINLGKRAAGPVDPTSLLAAMGAGLVFGTFSIVLSEIGHQAGLWPLVVAYLVRLLLLGTVVLVMRPSGLLQSCLSIWQLAGAAGIMVTVATAAFLLSLQTGGELAVVSTIANQVPVVTVLLAIVLLKERPSPVQAGGLLAGFASLVLMSL